MDAAQPFRLLELPLLPHRDVLCRMDLSSVFSLSFLNWRMKFMVRELRLKAVSFNITVSQNVYSVTIGLQNKKEDPIVNFVFRLDRVPTTSPFININGESVQMAVTKNVFEIKRDEDQDENIRRFGNLMQHLQDLLIVENFSARSKINDANACLFQHTQKFSSLILHNQVLTIQQANFIFNDLEIDELKLKFTSVQSPNGSVIFPLKHRAIYLDSCEWLSFESLYTMTCQRLVIGKGNKNHLRVAHLIEFIRSWSNGGLNDLREVTIELPKTWLKSDLESGIQQEIFDSLSSMDLVEIRSDIPRKFIKRNDDQLAELSIDRLFFRFTVLRSFYHHDNVVLP